MAHHQPVSWHQWGHSIVEKARSAYLPHFTSRITPDADDACLAGNSLGKLRHLPPQLAILPVLHMAPLGSPTTHYSSYLHGKGCSHAMIVV